MRQSRPCGGASPQPAFAPVRKRACTCKVYQSAGVPRLGSALRVVSSTISLVAQVFTAQDVGAVMPNKHWLTHATTSLVTSVHYLVERISKACECYNERLALINEKRYKRSRRKSSRASCSGTEVPPTARLVLPQRQAGCRTHRKGSTVTASRLTRPTAWPLRSAWHERRTSS